MEDLFAKTSNENLPPEFSVSEISFEINRLKLSAVSKPPLAVFGSKARFLVPKGLIPAIGI